EPRSFIHELSGGDDGKPLRFVSVRDSLAHVVALDSAHEPRLDLNAMPTPSATIESRQERQVQELVDYTQRLLRRAHKTRDQRFAKLDRSSVTNFDVSANEERQRIHQELFGALPTPQIAPNPRTRLVFENPEFSAYEVVLDVYADVIASGILLLPTDLRPGEKRPVVVCQHGLEGTPMDTIAGPEAKGFRAYKSFAAELARRGFIVYAPQNPYRGGDAFRTLQRKSNLLGRSLFSYIIPQHLVTLRWLSSLEAVDANRIGFYGLSYGGKTAVRVPPMLPPSETEPGYCLSICSADFNEWVAKNASTDAPFSYVWTPEYEIFEWNMGHIANYAELSMLMTPRPFMVERGHDDGVGIDEWVAWEYAKVRRHYNKLGIGKRTEIEFFDGPHTINGKGTYDFLHRHLKWPRRATHD
ncbi:MAG: alpha/beta hydrolase family protein, partial [Rubripirellula sp.]